LCYGYTQSIPCAASERACALLAQPFLSDEKKAGLFASFSEEQQRFMDMLEPMNIECRYPTHKEQLMKSLSAERCRQLIDNSRELQQWIRKRL
jgi:hypothetical protein